MAIESMTAQDRKWQAENDARTLISAEEINLDSARKGRALTEAKKIAIIKKKEMKAAEKVASKKTKKRVNK